MNLFGTLTAWRSARKEEQRQIKEDLAQDGPPKLSDLPGEDRYSEEAITGPNE
jgi:hypothetical protein